MMGMQKLNILLLLLLILSILTPSGYSQGQTGSSAGYTVIASPGTVVPNGNITVQWRAPSTHSPQDWIGLYLVGLADSGSAIIAFKYVPTGTSGIMSFKAPNTLTPHTYEFRYFLNNGYAKTATSNAVNVTRKTSTSPAPAPIPSPTPPTPPPSPTSPPATTSGTATPTQSSPPPPPLSVGYTVFATPATIAKGGTITVSWRAPSTHSSQDWIGLYLVGIPDTSSGVITHKYVPAGTVGVMTFTIPSTLSPHAYEFRYFLNNGFSKTATSNPVTVLAGTAPTLSPAPPPPTPSTTPPPPSQTSTPSTAGTCPNGKQIAFPGAEGFGRCAQGGRSGRVIEVTNLNDEGPGSFRQCAQVESGPRTCVFRVSGTIGLNTYDIEVTNPYLTIDGSTSSGGIALKDGGLWIRASHVIVRHLRVRPGPASLIQRGSNANGISIQSSATGPISDVIIDHASVSWGTDDLMYSIFGSDNVTIQWSILSEALECAQCGGKGLLLDAKNTTVHHSLYAHTYIRWPQMNKGNVDFVNNVKYNGNGTDAQLQPVYGPILANFVGNYFKDGPSAWTQNLGYSEIRAIGNEVYGSSSGIFVQGNIGRYTPAGASMPLWGLATPDRAIIWNDGGGFSVLAQRYPYPQVTTTSAQQAYEDVLNGAGAFPRDSADVRIVNDVRNGTGRWIVDPSDVGGWPVLASGTPPPDTDHDGMPDAWETAHGLNPNDPSDGPQDTNGNGYTNVEEFLHSLHIQAP